MSPCSTCGAYGIRDLGTRGYCGLHLAELYNRFRPETFDGIGVGIPNSNAELDQHLETLLTCNLCGATWHGRPAATCTWCLDAVARMVADQRQTLLWPDWLIEQGDRYDQLDDIDKQVWDRTRGISRHETVDTWAEKLRHAVDAGIITKHEAHTAIERYGKKDAA